MATLAQRCLAGVQPGGSVYKKESETVVEKRIESAAIIAAALLRHHPNPSTEKIIDLLAQALEAIDAAVGLENRRSAKRQADLKVNTMVKR